MAALKADKMVARTVEKTAVLKSSSMAVTRVVCLAALKADK